MPPARRFVIAAYAFVLFLLFVNVALVWLIPALLNQPAS